MLLAGLFAACLLLALLAGDWWQFTRLTASASTYGCRVARAQERVRLDSLGQVQRRFDEQGLLRLGHGIARFFPEQRRILLRPQYQLSSSRFRTAWPIKGTIELDSGDGTMRLTCTKLMPWSSALLTLLWFTVVGAGTAIFVVSFLREGGTASLGGFLIGLGVTALGLLVLAFGLVTVSLAYRLEDHRLMQAYQELRAALTGDQPRDAADPAV